MRRLFSVTLIATMLGILPAAAQEPVDLAMVARIKQEGLQRSRARELYFTLTDRIGARLTASPAHSGKSAFVCRVRTSYDQNKQSAVVLASFAWHAAQRNERIPRAK